MALRNKNNRNRQARSFAMESLDKRELFAADVMGAAELAVQTETAQVASSVENLEIDNTDRDETNGREDGYGYYVPQLDGYDGEDPANASTDSGSEQADSAQRDAKLRRVLMRLRNAEVMRDSVDGTGSERAQHNTTRSTKAPPVGQDVEIDTQKKGTRRGGPVKYLDKASPMLARGKELDKASPIVSQGRHILGGGMTSVDADDVEPCLMPVLATGPASADLDSGVLTIVGTSGNDDISVTRDGANWIKVTINGTNDYFQYDDVNEIKIYGLCGDDVIEVGEEPGNSHDIHESVLITIYGGQGDDEIHGSDGDDLIFGGEGNDVIFGNGGNDDISGGEGNDEIHGGAGHDVIFGDAGNDWLSGGGGNDYLNGGDGNDELYGDAGWDSLYGGAGDDGMFGGSGWDFIDSGTDSGNPAQGDYGDADTVVLTEIAALKK